MQPHVWSLRVLRRLLFSFCLIANTAQAEQTITVPALDFAKSLIAHRNYEPAREILELLHQADPTEIEPLFLLAEIDAQSGDLESAVERYRAILVSEPNIPRVRLDLAAALFVLGEDAAARYHFRQALSQDLPPEVTRNVFRYLDRIRARQRFTFDLSLALKPDSNLNTGPSQSEVIIFGLPARLSEDARKQSGVGVMMTAAARLRHPLTDRWRLEVGGLTYRTEYEGGEFDDMFGRVSLGPQYLFRGGEVSLLAVADKRWYGNDPYAERFGPRIEASYSLSQRVTVEGTLEYLWTAYAGDRDYMDGDYLTLGFFPSYALSPSAYLTLVSGYGRERTQERYLDNDYYRIGIGYHQEVPYGLTLYLQPELTYYGYHDTDPLFGARRRDHLYRVQFSAYKRDWTLFGFSPVLSYIYTKRASNIDLYAYDRHQVQIGMTRLF